MTSDTQRKKDEHQSNMSQTYIGLRFAMVLLVVLLFVSVGTQIASADCWQTSISAYYHTPAHAVFVAVLFGMGACLIIYRGNSGAENAFLDLAGLLAFLVAFVPVDLDDRCGALDAEVAEAVANNVPAILVVALLATGLGLTRWARPSKGFDKSAWIWLGLSVAVIGAIWGIFHLSRDAFLEHGHLFAAFPMFGFIILVVILNAVGAKSAKKTPFAWWYGALTGLMVVTFIACAWVGNAADWKHWVLAVEAVLIAEFAAFWVIQTAELQGHVNRDAKAQDEQQQSAELEKV